MPAPVSDGWVQFGLLCLAMPLSLAMQPVTREVLTDYFHRLHHSVATDPVGAETAFAGLVIVTVLVVEFVLLIAALIWRGGSVWAERQRTSLPWKVLLKRGFQLGVPYGLVTYALLWWVDRVPHYLDYEGFISAPSAFFIPAACIAGSVGAVCEELYFRGAVYRVCRRLTCQSGAVFLNAVLFTGWHVHAYGNVPQLLSIAAGSWLYCWLLDRTGSTIPGIICHASVNVTAVLLSNVG